MNDALHLINPATEALIQAVPIDSPAEVMQKVQQAHCAQPDWANRSLQDRIEIIERFRDLLVTHCDWLAALLTTETGKPITQSLNELKGTPQRIDFFLTHTAQVIEPILTRRDPANAVIPGTAALEEVITYDPLGTIANISAWNYPYFIGTNVFVPALLTGNTVLYKPSEFSPLTGLAMAELLHEAGVPDHVFIPVIGSGMTGAALLAQPLDGVFFTGSYATGLKIAAAAPHLTRIQLELGGKDPAYVCEDVDVPCVAAALADGAFYNNGQSCCAVERIYVHQRIYESFIESFMDTVKSFQLGDPSDVNTYLGPVSRKPQLAELQRQVEDARQKGAHLLCGGERLDRPGWYFAPTVLTQVNHEMAVMRDETFGPVIGIQAVESDEAAVALMNDTAYGLTAAVYTADRQRAVRLLSAVRSGTAYWNCCDRVSPYLPWTGRGQSGFGSTLSVEGIRSFVQPRAWHLRA